MGPIQYRDGTPAEQGQEDILAINSRIEQLVESGRQKRDSLEITKAVQSKLDELSERYTEHVSLGDFHRTLSTGYFHQDQLSWSRMQLLLAAEVATIAAAFSVRTEAFWLSIVALAIGILFTWLIWAVVQRDWEIREHFELVLDRHHATHGFEMYCKPKWSWRRGRYLLAIVPLLVTIANILLILYVALAPVGKQSQNAPGGEPNSPAGAVSLFDRQPEDVAQRSLKNNWVLHAVFRLIPTQIAELQA